MNPDARLIIEALVNWAGPVPSSERQIRAWQLAEEISAAHEVELEDAVSHKPSEGGGWRFRSTSFPLRYSLR